MAPKNVFILCMKIGDKNPIPAWSSPVVLYLSNMILTEFFPIHAQSYQVAVRYTLSLMILDCVKRSLSIVQFLLTRIS